MTKTINEYFSDGASHSGDTLLEKLEDRGMTQSELALRMGRPRKTINELVKGKISITPETAIQLEMVLNVPASLWNKRERDFQEAKAREEQRNKLEDWTLWLDQVPYNELIERGWINASKNKIDLVGSTLSFFGVVSPEQWQALWADRLNVAFRKSQVYEQSQFSVATWLRCGELLANEIDCQPYSESKFRQALVEIRSLTTESPSPELYQHQITQICQDAGVAVVLVPRLKQSRVFGASQWASPRKAVIMLSLYFSTDDIFWYNFFHEAGHIILHSKKEVYVDWENEDYGDSETESEANEFARETLIPTDRLIDFLRNMKPTKSGDPYIGPEEICEFAEELGIAPSIIVGRLQHDNLLNRSFNNKFKAYLRWDDDDQITVKPAEQRCGVL